MSIRIASSYFNIPHNIFDSGLLSRMSGSEVKLYMALWKLANRFSSAVFFKSDEELLFLTGIKDSKTLTKAKKALKSKRLIDYRKQAGRRTDYHIYGCEQEEPCDVETTTATMRAEGPEITTEEQITED